MQILQQLNTMGVTVNNLCADSRAVRSGDVFVASPGARVDGRRFIADAVERKAAAVLWEKTGNCVDDVPLGMPLGMPLSNVSIPSVAVENLQALSGYLAHLVYGRPSEKMRVVGVTGTNGKTSITHWVAQAYELLGQRCAVVGTLGCGFAGELSETLNTTPDAITLHRLFASYVSQGAKATAIEVSSIGIDQGRVNAIRFDTAVFTNLTRDHLDYHGTVANYAAAKTALFQTAGLKTAVLNLDDALGVKIATELNNAAFGKEVRCIGYSLRPSSEAHNLVGSLLLAENITPTTNGLRFTVVFGADRAEVSVPMVGEFNVANLLAVLGALLAGGVAFADAAAVLSKLTPPLGRMQTLRVDNNGTLTPLAVIDYAHTPDALEQALVALRETAAARGGKLVCVFGCGGDRDEGKRPLMGKIAARLADKVILTSDNPRSEDPEKILVAISVGAPQAQIIVDRAEAIRVALIEAAGNDVVLIAGKGHEAYQEIAGKRLPFSDVAHAQESLTQRGGRTA